MNANGTKAQGRLYVDRTGPGVWNVMRDVGGVRDEWCNTYNTRREAERAIREMLAGEKATKVT